MMEWRRIDSLRKKLQALPQLTSGDVKAAIMETFHRSGDARKETELEIVLGVRLKQPLKGQHSTLEKDSFLLVTTEDKANDKVVPVYVPGVGRAQIPADAGVTLVPVELPLRSFHDFVVERLTADRVGPPLPGKDNAQSRYRAIEEVGCPTYTEEYFTVDGLSKQELWFLIGEYFARSGAIVELGERIYAGCVQYGSVDEAIIPCSYMTVTVINTLGQLSVCISQG